ncbi:hypothetical protein B5P43_16120 [Bacillus sp. SRB_336]|nr:hypothetical protein B5P43_16120 [Bacillus sp. SRB_336]
MQIQVDAGSGEVALRARVAALWIERDGEHHFAAVDPYAQESDPHAKVTLDAALKKFSIHGASDGEFDHHHRAAQIAKSIAETSRNAVADLREIRYEIEMQLVASSSSKSSAIDHTSVVESLLQLNIVCSRASDQARECIREGLWVHVTDSEAYHAYRRLQEPAIINPTPPAGADTRTWMRLHDAGMRQCVELRRQLEAESSSIRDLLSSAASISSSREADSQSRFNLLVAVISFALGVPALVLAVYGADLIMPLTTDQRTLAFIPILFGLVIAALLTFFKAPGGEHRLIWRIGAAGIVAVIILLIVAGLIAGSLGPRV